MRRGSFHENYPVTAVLLLLNVAFYCLEVIANHRALEIDWVKSALDIDGNVVFHLGANFLPALREGEWWRLLSHAYLHGGIWHILFNAWVLADLGRICEPLLGRSRYITVYTASALGGGLGSVAEGALLGRVHLSVGASGALMGLIGLLLGFSLRHRDRQLRNDILRWIIYIGIFSFVMGGVDHAAHAGGLVVGTVFGFLTPRYVSSGAFRAWLVPCVLSIGATAWALAMALWHHFK